MKPLSKMIFSDSACGQAPLKRCLNRTTTLSPGSILRGNVARQSGAIWTFNRLHDAQPSEPLYLLGGAA
jgi:hypothetical protein